MMESEFFQKYRCVDEDAVNHPKFPANPILYAVKLSWDNLYGVAELLPNGQVFHSRGSITQIPGKPAIKIPYGDGAHISFDSVNRTSVATADRDYIITHENLPGRFQHMRVDTFEGLYELVEDE